MPPTDPANEDLRLSVQAFQREHYDQDAESELAALLYFLDAQEQFPTIRGLRDWTLSRLAPREGETAVDVGCGTGAEVRRMAELVGVDGRVIGVEPHPGMRAEAESRAAGLPGISFVDGDALALPFQDGEVDVLRCERVWQHVSDAERAAAEVARVLGPGGRAAIVDTDWGSFVGHPGDPDLQRRISEVVWQEMANPFVGRRLRALLLGAGLTLDDELGSAAVVLPDWMLVDPAMLRDGVESAVAAGRATQAESDAFLAEVSAAARRGEATYAVCMFAAVARQPTGQTT